LHQFPGAGWRVEPTLHSCRPAKSGGRLPPRLRAQHSLRRTLATLG
jgi:hypothetical protein